MRDRTLVDDVACFAALLVLLGAAVGVWLLAGGLAAWVGLTLGLCVAAAKAGLIAVVFMDLRVSRALVWIFAVAGVYWGAILLVLTLADVLTRG